MAAAYEAAADADAVGDGNEANEEWTAEDMMPFSVQDLPPEIRLKIDEIISNHEDFEEQIVAIDALLFGRKFCEFVLTSYTTCDDRLF